MTVRGINFRERKTRLSAAFCEAASRRQAARRLGDWTTVALMEVRERALRLAWQRLDDHLYPKGIHHAAR